MITIMDKQLIRDIKIDIISGRYKATSAYKIHKNTQEWLECTVCKLRPLVWSFDNGNSTACGCGENQYKHFSIHTESIMSYVLRNGSSDQYDCDKLMKNWNHWVKTGEILESHQWLRENNRW